MREELAWAAGFFDGEGCTTAHRRIIRERRYVYVSMSVSQTGEWAEDILVRWMHSVGWTGVVRGPYKSASKEEFYQAHVYGFEKVQATVVMLWEFLGRAKRIQALRVLQEYHNRKDLNV